MVVRSGSADAQNLVELSQSYQVIRGDSQETKLKKKKKKETKLSQADLSGIRKAQENNTQVGGLSHHYDVI